MSEEVKGRELGWDDVIEIDDPEYNNVILDEGDYKFKVVDFKRGRTKGSDKMPASNKATLTLSIIELDEPINVFADLVLNTKLEWKLSQFFRSIGLKKHGERLSMDWSKVPGAYGYAHIAPRKYKDKDGNEKEVNNVVKFLEYDPSNFTELERAGFDSADKSELPFV